MSNGKVILYASEQTGENLPGYVRFALKHLAETDFTVVLLTNKRPLSAETIKFLEDNEIKLYLTEGPEHAFAMWRSFLKDLANGRSSLVEFNNITRLLLVNDTIVYFQNNFDKFIRHAESNPADAISLTQSDEIHPHLQSFFLYLKQEALGAFYLQLLETPERIPSKERPSIEEIHTDREISLARAFDEAEVQTASLYSTQQNGFIPFKLLQKKFSNYRKQVLDAGLAEDFDEEWLPKPIGYAAIQVIDSLRRAAAKVLPHKAN